MLAALGLGAFAFARRGDAQRASATVAVGGGPSAGTGAPGPWRWTVGGDTRHTGRSARRGPRRAPTVAWRVRTRRRVSASPGLTAEGWVVFASLDGGVHAVDGAGRVRWSRLGLGRVFASPAVSGDLVVVGADGGAFVGLGPRGVERWRIASDEDCDAPAVVGDDGAVYVASRWLRAREPDGRTRYSVNLAGHVFGAPALHGDTLYVPEMPGAVAMLRASDGGLVRRVALPALQVGGVLVLDDGGFVVGSEDGQVRAFGPDGAARWSFATQGAARGLGVRTTPALRRDGTVVFGAEDGGFYGVAAADGRSVFRVQTAGPVRSSAAVDADDWSYFGSQDDRVYAVDAAGAVAWSVSLGADVDGSPVLFADGALAVGADDGALHALVAGND